MTKKSDQPQITIPKADEREVVSVPEGSLGIINRRFEKIDQILFGIMLAIVLSLVAIIISVVGLFLDQMRFNNAAYTDYSQKLEERNLLLKQFSSQEATESVEKR